MYTTTHPARRRGHLSRHERQRLARAEAFSRHTPPGPASATLVKLEPDDLALIGCLVGQDRTAVSSALLAIAGVGSGAAARRAVLAHVSKATCWAQAEGAISPSRAAQIARHVKRALGHYDRAVAA